ncbi:MAG: S8 family serine peptidase, partial [Bacillota bacterium]|nr:S8 family serine peptidase [Bacillota bacterium]
GGRQFVQTIEAMIEEEEIEVLGGRAYSSYELNRDVIAIPIVGGVLNLVVAEIEPQGQWAKFSFDGNGHGTHIAGIIGANGLLEGIAPEVELIVIKALDSNGESDVPTIMEGIKRAAASGANIVNLSLGYQLDPQDTVSDALTSLIEGLSEEYNLTFVVAAGNDGPGLDSIATPGSAQGAITVGAYISPEMWKREFGLELSDYVLWPYSSVGPSGFWGLKPELVAPGVTWSTFPLWAGEGYYFDEGTSMAAPQVTGLLALIIEAFTRKGESYSPYELKQALIAGASPIKQLSILEQGYGKVDGMATWQALTKEEAPVAFQGGFYLGEGLVGYLNLREFSPGILDLYLTNLNEGEQLIKLNPKADWISPELRQVRIPAKSTRRVPIYYSLTTEPGVRADLLTLILDTGQEIDLVNSSITPISMELDRIVKEGVLGAGELERYYISVAPDTQELNISLRIKQTTGGSPLGRARVQLFDPNGRLWGMTPTTGADNMLAKNSLTSSIRVFEPEAGVWEVVVSSSSWLSQYNLIRTEYILNMLADNNEPKAAPETASDHGWIVGIMPKEIAQEAYGQMGLLWIYNNEQSLYNGLVLVNNVIYQVTDGRLLIHKEQLEKSTVTLVLLAH